MTIDKKRGINFKWVLVVASVLAANFYPLNAHALESAGWRMDGTSCYPDATPPTEWSPTKNVIWKTPLPNWSSASPVLMNGLLFCCGEPESFYCIDASTGKVIWERTHKLEDVLAPEELAKMHEADKAAALLRQERTKLQSEAKSLADRLLSTPNDDDLKTQSNDVKTGINGINDKLQQVRDLLPFFAHDLQGYSCATPITDGEKVYAIFGNGIAVCYDTNGHRIWIRRLGHTGMFGSSPMLSGGKVLVPFANLTALDAATGSTAWMADGKTVRGSFGSPTVVQIGDTPTLLTPAGDLVRVSDGHVMAKNLANLMFCSPIVHEGIAYFIETNGKALKLPEMASDTISPEIIWKTQPFDFRQEAAIRGSSHPAEIFFASPIFHDGMIYSITRFGLFGAIDAKTGIVLYQKMLDYESSGDFFPSITFAGKYLFVSGDKGETFVIQPGSEYKEIARNTLEKMRATPVFDGKRIYFRGFKSMYCIGEQP